MVEIKLDISLSELSVMNNMHKLLLLLTVTVHLARCCKPQLSLASVDPPPRILSSLYGYNDCIGGENNFDTYEEYLEDLKRRNCTVENGRTNVADSKSLNLACFTFQSLKWLDGMPVVFNYPLDKTPDPEAIQVELSDGSKVSPECVMLGPANEKNEKDTLLILGQFGDGPLDTVRPETVRVVGEVNIVTEEGLVSATGISYSNPGDMNYLTSTVRMVRADLWDVETIPENFTHPLWPLPSSVYPNNCGKLFDTTTHVLRATFSGGVTTDGIASIMPSNKNIFKITKQDSSTLDYLGLADLGQNLGEDAPTDYDYEQDGDNYVDICLDLSNNQDMLDEGLGLEVLCDASLEKSVLYPPKGKPYGCKNQKVTLTKTTKGKFLLEWI